MILDNWHGIYDDLIFHIPFSNYAIIVDTLRLFYIRLDSEAHWNDGYEMHIVTKGKALYSVNNHNDYLLQSGELLVISPHMMHSERVYESCEGICLGFQILPKRHHFFFSTELQKESDRICRIFESYLSNCFYLKNCESLLSRFSELLQELKNNQDGRLLCAHNMIANILIELSRLMASGGSAVEKPHKHPDASLFYNVSQYFSQLSKNGKTDFSLKELADLLYMSERQAARFLPKYYKKTFIALLNDSKVEHIKYLLGSTALSVEEIAEKCGWTSKYLYRCFKQNTGMTPAEFRKQSQD